MKALKAEQHLLSSDLYNRALTAYFRGKKGQSPDQPSRECCSLETAPGREYVVLRNNYRTLAVYRLAHERLRALDPEDWPEGHGE